MLVSSHALRDKNFVKKVEKIDGKDKIKKSEKQKRKEKKEKGIVTKYDTLFLNFKGKGNVVVIENKEQLKNPLFKVMKEAEGFDYILDKSLRKEMKKDKKRKKKIKKQKAKYLKLLKEHDKEDKLMVSDLTPKGRMKRNYPALYSFFNKEEKRVKKYKDILKYLKDWNRREKAIEQELEESENYIEMMRALAENPMIPRSLIDNRILKIYKYFGNNRIVDGKEDFLRPTYFKELDEHQQKKREEGFNNFIKFKSMGLDSESEKNILTDMVVKNAMAEIGLDVPTLLNLVPEDAELDESDEETDDLKKVEITRDDMEEAAERFGIDNIGKTAAIMMRRATGIANLM